VYSLGVTTASERTFSFRAPDDFGDRVREASVILDDLAKEAGVELGERLGRQLVLALYRDGGRFQETRGNQSAFVRESVELLVDAAEKVASDLHYAREYAKVAAEETDEDAAFRRAAETVAAERWRND
jgi:hypothetical protein